MRRHLQSKKFFRERKRFIRSRLKRILNSSVHHENKMLLLFKYFPKRKKLGPNYGNGCFNEPIIYDPWYIVYLIYSLYFIGPICIFILKKKNGSLQKTIDLSKQVSKVHELPVVSKGAWSNTKLLTKFSLWLLLYD